LQEARPEDRRGEKGPFTVTPKNLARYLGAPRNLPETEGEVDEVGVATGLAWTPTGGDILFVEVSLVDGKGGVLITGSLGDVMKESAQAAITYVRSRAAKLGLPRNFHAKHDVHIHVPSGGYRRTVLPPGSRSRRPLSPRSPGSPFEGTWR